MVLMRANLLSIYVGQNSPLFGPLLRTSCDLDNICLGDTIPEASEIYPNEQLELKILPTEAPILNVTEGAAKRHLNARNLNKMLDFLDLQNINKLDNNNSLQTSINTDNDLLFVSENVDNSILEINNLFDDNLQNITSISNNFNDFELRREGSIEIIFTQQTVNNLFLKAFRANLLSIYVSQSSPLFGPLLRTSCDLDNVCLGDTIPEASEIYPNEQLELKIVPTEAPILNVTEDLATLSLSGVGIFSLARDPFGQQIAQIPFFTIVELNIGKENVSLSIPKLEILENADFFQVPVATLQEGFRDSILNAIINFAKKFLNMSSGSAFRNILERKLCKWGILNPRIKLLTNGMINLIVKDVDVYKLFGIDSDDFLKNFSIKDSFIDSKCICC
uniref:Lipid-binding serum glycoprotein C-terminal domain-containing protein n=1 Tax=Meloidogyne incognita TaxID=6306 RepID=A0A914M9J4_MELIC